jgi:hypothetical protein
MGVALYIVLETAIENLDPFVDGKMLARAEPELNERAVELGVAPLMEFFSFDPEEILAELDLEELKTAEPVEEKWFAAADGLKTVGALLADLEKRPGSLVSGRDITPDVIEDLRNFQRILLAADDHRVRWYLAIY